MENAAKALMIAAGILIAIVITSVLVSTFSTMNSFQMSKLSEEERQQIIEFNEQYIKYVNQYVYGTEVITVINRTLDNKTYPITVKIKFANNGNGYTYKGYEEYLKNGKKRWKKVDVEIKRRIYIRNRK